MAPKLYMGIVSPASRGAMMACEYFKVPVEMVTLDLMSGAHLTAEYLKKNPLHTIPVFEDGDFVLHDSHAIIQYLADTYGNDDTIYPKDPKQRAKINQILFFDQGHLSCRLGEIMLPAWMEGVSHVTQKNLDRLDEVYGFVEEFLSRTKYIASNNLTIADFSIAASLSSLHLILALNATK
nr:glutathione S-transferase epsilon 3 [Ectropis grisescens]